MVYRAVAQECDGVFTAPGVMLMYNDIDIAEIEALCFELELAIELSLSPLVVESDSLLIFQLLST